MGTQSKNVTIDEGADVVIEDSGDEPGVATAVADALVIEDEAEGEVKKKKLPARAVRNDDGTVTLPLLKPVTIGFKSSTTAKVRQETTSELTFHELTGADMRIVIQQTPDMQPVALLARSARIAINRMTPLFDRMAQRDISAATDILTFLSE